MKKSLSIIALIFICSQSIFAQNNEKEALINQIATHREGSNWYRFDKGVKISKENLNTSEVKRFFELNVDNFFQLIKSETDDVKIKHHVFQQTYKGYPIQFAIFKLHELADQTVEGNGHYVPKFTKQTPKTISFAEALNFAKQHFPAEKYMWEDSMEEASLRLRGNGIVTTYFPKEELVWAISNHNLNDLRVDNYVLAYKMQISGSVPWFSKEIYIDATTGRLLNAYELESNCGSHSFTSIRNGTQTVSYSNTSFTHKLIDSCGVADIIYTSDNGNSLSPYTKSMFSSWPNTNNFNSAATSTWALQQAENYFKLVHYRSGWSGAFNSVDLRQNAIFYTDKTAPYDSAYYHNASFSFTGGVCRVGNNQSGGPDSANTLITDDINSVDVLGHEMTHGITYSATGLVYNGEPGALNESFSDIFGINVYQNLGGYSAGNLWKIGYDIIRSNGTHDIFRDMQNPHNYNCPNTYQTDPFWLDTTATAWDNGAVHINSGVQNYMYYLLVSGGSGTNANGFAYNIPGLGFVQARAIAYKALTSNYLNANSNHAEARDAWVHAAVDLYGSCSVQSQAVGKAWEAVGVGSYWYYGNNMCGTYSGPQTLKSNSPYFISVTGCATTIQGTGNLVQFDGAEFVDIYPGFNTNTGAYFKATTNDCAYSNY